MVSNRSVRCRAVNVRLLAIGRAMYFGAKVLILDEPTSALGVKESAYVLKLMLTARDAGVGLVFITHNARHAMAVGDDFTVLIQGKVAAQFVKGEKTREEVLNLMAGGEEMADSSRNCLNRAPQPVAPSCVIDKSVALVQMWRGHSDWAGPGLTALCSRRPRGRAYLPA